MSWGKVGDFSMPSSALGASLDWLYGYYSYSQIRSLLGATVGSAVDKGGLANLPGSVGAPSNFVIPAAEAKALGIVSGSASGIDGYIGFAGSSTSTYNYGSTIARGKYDFTAVAAHEIAEVLGGLSGLEDTSPNWRTPFDLFGTARLACRAFPTPHWPIFRMMVGRPASAFSTTPALAATAVIGGARRARGMCRMPFSIPASKCR